MEKNVLDLIAKGLSTELAQSKEDVTIEHLKLKVNEIRQNANLSDDQVGYVEAYVRSQIQIVVGKSGILVDKNADFIPWLNDEREKSTQWYYWERFQKYFYTKGINKEVLLKTDEITQKVLARLGDPLSDDAYLTKGMVIGDVQAGKTNNYSALINKAADVGYKVIIVLTGMIEDLRSQTQERLDEDFVGRVSQATQKQFETSSTVGVGKYGSKSVICFTDRKYDFGEQGNIHADQSNDPLLIVTKKNKSPLNKILKWLENQSGVTGAFELPVLVIDDESDNASVNTGAEDEDPKTINLLIRKINAQCRKLSYVAYTATPFANIFIHPDSQGDASELEDLFPSDFIVSLGTPENYCGAAYFFDNKDEDVSSRVLQLIDEDKASLCLPIKHKSDVNLDGIPYDLKDAIGVFLIACAVKDIRREKGLRTKVYDSMLINMSRLQKVQDDLKYPVIEALDDYWDGIQVTGALNQKNHSGSLNKLADLFVEHYPHVEESWSEILTQLVKMDKPEVVVIHGNSDDPLLYDDKYKKKKIVIGGIKLSRGLTLEGLVVSYFYRSSVMADALMQMGRWYGYRDGYRDLLKLWLTEESLNWYSQIVRATEDLKNQVSEMSQRNLTPREYGMKVMSSPDALIVTAKNKMRHSETYLAKVDFYDKHLQTHCAYEEPEIIDRNFNEFENFLDEIDAYKYTGTDMPKSHSRHCNFRDVPFEKVSGVLEKLQAHPGSGVWAFKELFPKFLEKEKNNLLKLWDVSVFINDKPNKNAVGGVWKGQRYSFYTSNRSSPGECKKKVRGKNPIKLPPGLIVSGNSNLSTEEFEAIGITKSQYEALKKEGDITRGSYRAVPGRKPNLIFVVVNVTPKKDFHPEPEWENKQILCWTLSIPANDGQTEDEYVEFLVTKDWLRLNQMEFDFDAE